MAVRHTHPLLHIEQICRYYTVGPQIIPALNGVTLDVKEGEFVVIFGPSGCGKSTLLNVILGIDAPTEGRVVLQGHTLSKLSDDARGDIRAQKIGTVYQSAYWIKSINILENIALPLIIKGIKPRTALARAYEQMEYLGIEQSSHRMPVQFSGGEQQKAGLARALVTDPAMILADEPTGNLDSTSAMEIMKTLRALNRADKRTIILVTHNEDYWEWGTRRIEMKDGQIVKDVHHG